MLNRLNENTKNRLHKLLSEISCSMERDLYVLMTNAILSLQDVFFEEIKSQEIFSDYQVKNIKDVHNARKDK